MKFAASLILAVTASVASFAAAPGTMDTTRRDDSVSTDRKAVLPDMKPVERNTVIEEHRFDARAYEKKDALVGERRSGIVVGETREKKTYVTPEKKSYDLIERKESAWSGKKSRFSTSEDAYRSRMAVRFQEKISDVSPLARNAQAVASKRTTFDRINRFVFGKNTDQRVAVTAAGSEKPAADASNVSSPGSATPSTP